MIIDNDEKVKLLESLSLTYDKEMHMRSYVKIDLNRSS